MFLFSAISRRTSSLALSDESVRIYSEDGVIAAIACYKECLYQNKNIIGLSLSEVIDLLNRVPDDYSTEEMSDGEQEIYDFNEYDMQIWINDNKVVTVFCSSEYEAG